MTRRVSRRAFEFLRGELSAWVDASLLTPEQAEAVSALYETRPYSVSRALLSGGALLLGLGVICAVAANWQNIPRAAREAVIVGAYLACAAAAAANALSSPRAARALFLLASLIFGAGVFLVAQMYHQSGHWSTAFGLWAAGVLPGALLLRDRAQTALFQTLAAVFVVGGDPSFFYEAARMSPLRSDILPAAALAVSWLTLGAARGGFFCLSAPPTLFFVYSRIERAADPVTALLVLWFAGSVCFAAFQASDGRPLPSALARWGGPLAGFTGLALSVPDLWRDWRWLNRAAALIPPWAADFPLGARGVMAAVAAALTVALMAYRLRRGSRAAAAFLVLMALRYFADRLFGFVSKATAFSALGALCLSAGLWLERGARSGKERGDD